MGIRLMKIAVIYFIIGVLLGLFLSVTHLMNLTSVHIHLNLLGWTSLAIAGLLYHLVPMLETTPAARWHFWLHNIGLPVMMFAIVLGAATEIPTFYLLATIGGVITILGILCFIINVLRNIDHTANSQL